MVRKLTVGSLLLALLLLAVPAGLLGFLMYSEAGLQFVVARLPERVGRASFAAVGASGTLAGGFELQRFTLQHDLVALRIEGVRARVRVLPLLWQSIDARDVSIRSARVELRRREKPPPKRTPRFLPGLLSVHAESVDLAAATLVLLSGRELDFRDIKAGGVVRTTTIRFYRAVGQLDDLRIDTQGVLTAADPIKMAGSSRLTYAARGQPRWFATADFDGDIARLPVRAQLLQPFRADLPNGSLAMLGDWIYRGRATIQDFDLQTFGGGPLLGKISGALELEIDRNGYRARGPLDSAGLQVGLFDTEFDGTYAQRVVSARRIVVTHRESSARLEARGDIGFGSPGPKLDLTGTWTAFRWPLRGAAPAVLSRAGEFSLRETWPYALQASGTVDAPALGITDVPATVTGRLDRDRIRIETSTVQLFGSNASLSGEAQWSPQEQWAFEGPVRGLNPGELRPDLPGRLDFQLAVRGKGFDGKGRIEADIQGLRGKLRGATARGAGFVALERDVWQFDRVNFSAGGLRLALDGSLTAAARDLRFRLDATDLSVIDADSRGNLRMTGSLQGTAQEPILSLNATGAALSHSGVRVGSLAAKVEFDPRSGKTSDVNVRVENLSAFDRSVERIDFKLQGQSEKHVATLNIDALDFTSRIRADGSFADGVWRAAADRLDLDIGNDVRLRLDGTLPVRASIDGATVDRFCLQGKPGRLCGDGAWNARKWETHFDAAELPLTALTAGLTPRIRYEGMIALKGQVAGSADGPVIGGLRANLTDALLRRKRSGGKEDVVRLGSGAVNATLDAASLSATMNLDAGDTGRISGELTAQRTAGAVDAMPLRASLNASTSALAFVNLFVPQIDRAAGRLDAALAIGGTLGTPLLSGVLKLSGGELDLYQINLALRATAFEARLIDNGLSFEGSGKAGEGTLGASGKLAWRDGLPYGDLTVKGSDLLLVNVPEARVTASPNLQFTVSGRNITATGVVIVPFARIAPADLTGAVVASSDERLVGAPVRNPEEAFRVSSNIRLVLGERVRLDTFGLSGRLAGNLTTQTTPDGASRGTGELGVTDGKYAALGRRLDIERGRLIFTGGFLADPAIDIRATKVFPEVKAGVNVRGTLREPRMTFFSEPSLPQSQIVSLILAGGTLENAQNSERSGAGRNAILAQGGAILAQQLGSKIGIEDVGIEQNLANETSLVLGKYLSPRLYVSYGISLAESINTLKMRYSLNDRWTLKTEAGREQSAEIVYTIEK